MSAMLQQVSHFGAQAEAWLLSLRSGVIFSLRTMLACTLALWVAFLCQLESPYWAALTVWIIAHPHPSQIVEKGFFRIVGTVIGAVFSVFLVAGTAQAPELFIAGLALWSGLCTACAVLLRNFQSYSAMLAGYTAAIVSIPATAAPHRIFEIAISRASCVALGVVAVAMVSSVLHRERTPAPQTDSSFHPDFRAAAIGGLRAALAIAATGALWIATASSTGAAVVLMTAILCGLFSTHPVPHRAALGFGFSILTSGVAAYFCRYHLIQQVDTFPLLMACLALFLLPAGVAMTLPRPAFFATGFAVNFVGQVQPMNPMDYNLPVFLNSFAASLAGGAFATLAFLLLFPRQAPRHD